MVEERNLVTTRDRKTERLTERYRQWQAERKGGDQFVVCGRERFEVRIDFQLYW